MLVTRAVDSRQICHEFVFVNLKHDEILDNIIKVLHFPYFNYYVSYLSIHPSHIYAAVVTNNSLFLRLCSLGFTSSMDHLILRWINSLRRWISSRRWIIFFLVMSSLSVSFLFCSQTFYYFLFFNFCQVIF